MESSVETPYRGTSRAAETPFAVAIAMRTPVNDPGPRPHTTQAIACLSIPHSESSASMRGSNCVFDARWASISTEAARETLRSAGSSAPSPIAMISFAVSNARIYGCVNSLIVVTSSILWVRGLSRTCRFASRAASYWVCTRRDFESFAHTNSRLRARSPNECAWTIRMPFSLTVMSI